MEYLFVCSTIDIQMKNHLHCYRYQRLKYKFNYTSLVKFVYFSPSALVGSFAGGFFRIFLHQLLLAKEF